MKFTLVLLSLLFEGFLAKAQGPEFRFWFTQDNVDVYSRWTCNGCDDQHIQIKLVNRNHVKVTYDFEHLIWKSNGVQVSEVTGAQDDIQADQIAGDNGDLSGLYFYPPKGYALSSLTINITNFKIYIGGKP